jgi:hypothetical protein
MEKIPPHTAALISGAIASPAKGVPHEVRRLIESRLGFDLKDIHIHVGCRAAEAATALGAKAFSVCRHIVFAEDQFCLGSSDGLRLLVHELAHAVQQTGSIGLNHFILPTDDTWECFANAFTAFVLDGSSHVPSCLPFFPIAPAGMVLCHARPECPKWVTVSAKRKEVYLAANKIIELAYKASHYGHVVFYDSDFDRTQAVTLPRDAKLSDIDRQFANNLLLELKGLEKPLRPDIVDFTERKFYEIKAEEWALSNPSEAADQLANYYRITEAIRTKYAGPPWDPFAPDWYPDHTLPFIRDPNRIVCTSATMYMPDKEHLNTLNRPGLILYRVLEKPGSDEERKKRAKSMRTTDLAPELQDVRPLFQRALQTSLSEADDREYLIVCTREFVDAVLIPRGAQNNARILSFLNVPALDIYRNPVVMLRFLGWSAILTAEVSGFIVLAVYVLPEAAELAALFLPEAAELGPALPRLIQVPEAIVNGMKAANDVVRYQQAAGIMFLIGTTLFGTTREAQAATIKFDRIGSVRAIPVNSTWVDYTLSTGVKIEWDGTEYFYLGRASSAT